MSIDLIVVFKKVVTDPLMSWVLFKNGTCVMLLEPQKDIKTQAIQILGRYGRVSAGTPSGDFEVIKIPEINGWIVTGDYPGIMMYVSLEEGKKRDDVKIGLIGRNKREQDAKELEVVYVENKQKNA